MDAVRPLAHPIMSLGIDTHFIVKKMKTIHSEKLGHCKSGPAHFLDASKPLELQGLHHVKKAVPKMNHGL